MRAIILTTLMTLGLTGGVAAADGYRGDARRDEVRDHRPVREERVEQHRDYRARPAVRFERHEERRGLRWVGGEWRWNRFEWVWLPGHYVRAARW
jgi:hypothetical protein